MCFEEDWTLLQHSQLIVLLQLLHGRLIQRRLYQNHCCQLCVQCVIANSIY